MQFLEKGGLSMAGRKPKPTALKKLEGNPGKRKLNTKEPMPEKGMPDCPKWLLPEAKEEWKRLCQKLSEMGVLTESDMAAFAAYMNTVYRYSIHIGRVATDIDYPDIVFPKVR